MVKYIVKSYAVLILISLPQIICKSSNSKIDNPNFRENISPSLLEDADLETDELIAKYKYPSEKHHVTTEDGYILCMHRIPRQGAPPFLLLHGILDSSATYVVMGPHSGLGYYLWDQGYDVWMGNTRGNRYSKNHTNLDPAKREFWNFSFHEMGIYDLPAMVDFVLDKSGFKKLFYVGHSQGTTAFFIMCSKRREYNSKFILAHAMAPATYLTHNKLPLRPVWEPYIPIAAQIFPEILPRNLAFRYLCIPGTIIEKLCLETIFMLFGRNYNDFNMTMFPVLMGHIPAGSSTKQLDHYRQGSNSNLFREYDYGPFGNMQMYRKSSPPLYNLTKVTAPVVLHYSDNDNMLDVVDVERTSQELGNVVGKYKVPIPEWNHIDFVWGIRARSTVYELIYNLSKPFQLDEQRNNIIL